VAQLEEALQQRHKRPVLMTVCFSITHHATAALLLLLLLLLLQEMFSRIRKDLLREMKALKPGDRSAGGAARVLGSWGPVFRVCSSHGHGGNLMSLVP
jgi:hypothetical protein